MAVAAGIIGSALKVNRAEKLVQALTYHDLLTDLPNRRLFEDRLNQAIAYAKRQVETLAVLFIDIDGINFPAEQGVEIEDELLKIIARRISGRLRKQDTLARFGGNEFVAALVGIDLARNAGAAAEGILSAIIQPVVIGDRMIEPKAAIGIGIFPSDGQTTGELIREADIAMSEAKKRGAPGFRFFSEIRKSPEEAA